MGIGHTQAAAPRETVVPLGTDADGVEREPACDQAESELFQGHLSLSFT